MKEERHKFIMSITLTFQQVTIALYGLLQYQAEYGKFFYETRNKLHIIELNDS